jgi:hypothetical protein
MAETKRIEVGFDGGQVMSMRVDADGLAKLRKAVGDKGWLDLESEDGRVSLDATKVVFVRESGAAHTIGFSES